ncbi:MAG: hydroxymethylbilane synthase [Deltaproteobacteria bacterium]|nr:hydroxymethylbilane synthase [Deltaproteobacteria bacterium]
MRIGTRGSLLAMTQARIVAEALQERRPDLAVELAPIKTAGDRFQKEPLADIGGKGLFVKEIEEALLAGEIDCAVHSLKDMPAELPRGLRLAAVPRREDPRDVLVSHGKQILAELPPGARIGTGSLRRAMQLLRFNGSFRIIPVRGNLDTRLKKAESGELDAVVAAAAGLKRMGWTDRITQRLPEDIMLPAAGQGALGIEIREDDHILIDLANRVDHDDSHREVEAERAFIRILGGGCHAPVAALAKVMGERLLLRASVGTRDGRRVIDDEIEGDRRKAADLGAELAERIVSMGARDLLLEE